MEIKTKKNNANFPPPPLLTACLPSANNGRNIRGVRHFERTQFPVVGIVRMQTECVNRYLQLSNSLALPFPSPSPFQPSPRFSARPSLTLTQAF